jgi:hypothetical protein
VASNSNQWQSICRNSLGDKLYVTGKLNVSLQSTKIWESNDYGVTWLNYVSGTQYNVNFTSICCNSTGFIIAACVDNGFILVSTDRGNSFTNRASSRSWKSVCINAVGNRLAAVEGNIWTSSDSGTTWVQKTTTPQSWISICSNSLGDRLAATVQNGNIWISTDYGDTWTEKVVETGNLTWLSICSNGTGQILAATHDTVRVNFTRNSIYISTDYGNTWTQRVLPSTSYVALTSICSSTLGDNISSCMFNGSGIIYGFSTSTFLYKNLPHYYYLSLLPSLNTPNTKYTVANTNAVVSYVPNYNTTAPDDVNISKASYGASVVPYDFFKSFSPKIYVYTYNSGFPSYTHTVNVNCVRIAGILIGGGGAGGGGSQYEGGGGGAAGGSGATGQTFIFSTSFWTNNSFQVFVGKGGTSSTSLRQISPPYEIYNSVDSTNSTDSIISSASGFSARAYGGNNGSPPNVGSATTGGTGGAVDATFTTNNTTTVFFTSGVNGTNGSSELANQSPGGPQTEIIYGSVNNYFTSSDFYTHDGDLYNITTAKYGMGGAGGVGEGTNNNGPASRGLPGNTGVVVIFEYFL